MPSHEVTRTVGSVDLHTDPGTALLVPMSREQYDEIGEVKHAEWWDGVCVVTPGGMDHNRFSKRLFVLLDPHLPEGHELLWETGVRTLDADLIPDLSLFPATARVDVTNHWLLDPPLLVVEVLSPSTRFFDLAVKRERYAGHGIEWYWILDPANATLLVLHNDNGAYVEAQRITGSDTTTGPISVPIDVTAICR